MVSFSEKLVELLGSGGIVVIALRVAMAEVA
jgi:hypothetical protein